jgi:pyruvate dehydrogenase E2 component (dihydrolipoamide acetyltransferase)
MDNVAGEHRGLTQVPFTRMRLATARRMAQSVTTKPRVTFHASADLGPLREALATLRGAGTARLTITHLLVRVTAHVLAADTRLNGWVRDQVITQSAVVNLGIAVQTDAGLVTPVLRRANELRFSVFVVELDGLIERARTRQLHPRELGDGTFTVSNLGAHRLTYFTPIINPPQLAILGIGRAQTVPEWDGAAWRPQLALPLSLTFDHAALDGQPVAAWYDRLIGAIEDPDPELWR